MLICDPVIPFQKTTARMFLAVLYVIAKTLKLPLDPQIEVALATVWRQNWRW
jgi:hypothetical protein